MFKNTQAILFDIDGVLFVGNELISGAVETIEYLRGKKMPMRFLTNTTTRSHNSLVEKIIGMGLPIKPEEIFAPPRLTAHYLKQLGDVKLHLILTDDTKADFADFKIDEENPDYIVFGHYDNRWNYDLLNKLFKQIMNGSKMVALHKGRYWQTEEGLTLDIGGFVVGLEHATGEKAEVIGKPSSKFFEIALDDIGVKAEQAIMVGDDIVNDIYGAQNAGLKALLVKTGKYREEIIANSEIRPDIIINSVADLMEII